MKISIWVIIIPFILLNCKNDKPVQLIGEAQGTTYSITYFSDGNISYKNDVDSILKSIDQSLSTYVPNSIISKINKNDTTVVVDRYFTDVFNKALEISTLTDGAFDITVAPIVNAWGFGFTKKAEVDSAMIDSLIQYVGYKRIRLDNQKVIKPAPEVMLDFNAIAQGYTVDLLASFLESKRIRNYMIELGGEVKTKGKKKDNTPWKIGIDQPNETETNGRPLQAIIQLENQALATSGNYRKFYIENGKKYAHIIDPKTGYPVNHNLLSATVIAKDCMTADAFATSFMVMGMEKAKQFLSEHKNLGLEVFFIYEENGSLLTFFSDSLKERISAIH
ncbi:MAG TPA: FAD:protein FMN transferase [Chitinophagaceae bacterium]